MSTPVHSYSLGFKPEDKQFYFYYELEGEGAAHQLLLDAPEFSALADMFRWSETVSYNPDGQYFVSGHEDVGSARGR